ncbi:MAG: flagellar basal body-associated FliL family protein [Actinomycetota bacterium]
MAQTMEEARRAQQAGADEATGKANAGKGKAGKRLKVKKGKGKAEGEAGAEGQAGGTRKLGPKRLLLLAVVLAGLAAVATVVLLPGEEEADAEPEEGAILEVAQLTANLGGEDLRYARVGFAVVAAAEVETAEVERRFPLLQDAAISQIGAMTPEELHGEEGIDRLREALTERAREIYPDGEVLRVAITELLVQ